VIRQPDSPPFEAYFLPAKQGNRFCVYHPASGKARGGIVYLHPFAEELNKSRRMAALQARRFAASGYDVLQIDLHGCGDSSGDFADATWEIWCEDVALAVQHLQGRCTGKLTLWGLRLGALLALSAAAEHALVPDRFLLWQPVLSGETHLGQFLRIRVAAEMLAEGRAASDVKEQRAMLASGIPVEVAGYTISPVLAHAVDRLKLSEFRPRTGFVHWLEVVASAERPLPLASQRLVDVWSREGIRMDVQCVPGQSFWNSLEITECAALIDATSRTFNPNGQE
jgi:exosortase A-associated hydrolase 2